MDLEINEEDLFNASGAEVEEEHSSDNNIVAGDAALSPEGDDQDQSSDDDQEVLASMEIGGNSGSQKSTTLNVVLEEDGEVVQAEATSHYHRHGWGAPPRSSAQRITMAQSLPVSATHIKMGSSVPINIPFLGAPRRAGKALGDAGGVAQFHPPPGTTFIPPHQLSQRDDFSQCLLGESPGCSMKRERLRVRNAILKSTGFLEQSAPSIIAAAPGSIAVAAEDAAVYQHSVLLTPARGGLAKALQESSEVPEVVPNPL